MVSYEIFYEIFIKMKAAFVAPNTILPRSMKGGRSIQFSSPVDFNTLPVDCRNFLALTAAMLSCVCRGTKTMRANFSDH